MAAQATAHEIVLSGCQAHSTAYGVATATQQAEQWESTLHGLCEEANKAWKDANDVIFSHLLKYYCELATFLNSAEDTLKNKHDEIWGHFQSLMEATNCLPQTGLSLALQIPMMFAYGLELYELRTWGPAGDGGFHLVNHAWAANLLSHKLVHINSRASSCRASPSRVTSAAGSAV